MQKSALDAKLATFTNNRVSKTSIYCKDLFEGMTEKERKSARKRLRHSRDNAMQEFLACKDDASRKALALKWKEYATGIYADIFTIFESNTTEDKTTDLATFVQGLRRCLAPAPAKAKASK